MGEAVAGSVALEASSAMARVRAAVLARDPAVPALALVSGLLYLVNLTVSGYANTYYALAAQAGSQSWAAWFFGALDGSSFITLDKPPLATWLMGLSVRTFGLSSWSILLPQALLGIGTVLVLYLAVRRSFGRPAAFIAGLVMATTPVAVLIFRYDNPDALLTFLLVSAAWAMGRGLEAGRMRWPLLAAALVGAAFLTKFLQAYLVLPVFALTWLVSAPITVRRRVAGLLASAVVVLVTSGWWVAIMELLPASSRPYIGGSSNNSVLDLILGYDGLGRIFGNSAGAGLGSNLDGAIGTAGAAGGAGPGAGFGGASGILRMFNDQFGGQVAWLLPASIVALAVGLVLYRRGPRTDRRVAGHLLWGGWLLVHVAVFSLMSGIIHPYYTVALAPAIAALTGAGAIELWSRRRAIAPRAVLAATVLGTGALTWLLLQRTPTFAPGLGIGVLAIGAAAGLLLLIPADHRIGPLRLAPVAAALALVVILAGPLAYATATMTTPLSGGDPAAGPQVAGTFGDGAVGRGRIPISDDGFPGTLPGGRAGTAPGGGEGFPAGLGGGGRGGLEGGATADPAAVAYLLDNRGTARWIVAVSGSNSAAAVQLAAGEPVMAMGGFTSSDPAPTLAQLQAYIAAGDLRYVLPSGGQGMPGMGRNGGSEIATWVAASCTAVTIPGSSLTGLYDCASAAS